MDVVLPLKIKNEQKFFDCAFKLGFDEMSAQKFLYMLYQSDLDTFQKMADERINTLLYCWEMCEDYRTKLDANEWELPEELEFILKLSLSWSLDVWFSKEWERCKMLHKLALVYCLNRARDLLMRVPDMMQINWDFLLLYNLSPWQVVYLKSLTVRKEKTLETGAMTIEVEEQQATNDDISYINMEQLPIITLRLIKLFDQCSIDMVKSLCMRVIAAWNKVYHRELQKVGGRLPYVPPEDKRCMLLICHIYLMAVYEADDVKGYVIDNMISNIRFYYQGFQESTSFYAMDNMKYTPARFIALTCIHLRLQKREFFDFFTWNCFESSQVNLFGVVSQAYKSYLLGNLLMELNNMNEEDFAANVALYKRLMNSYVNEREKSEIFIANELQKIEQQHFAHNITQSAPGLTDFKSKICKGNRMSNIGNYENSDDAADDSTETIKKVGDEGKEEDKKESDLRVDPIFQNIPFNEEILYFVYDVLSKKSHRGWHFAKIVLLFKIISHELNMIETWRYHPGLTTSFMLNLETKLSQHYADLAKIFSDHPFIEQEFCLTAFYLNPTNYNYEAVKRLGMRYNRRKQEEQGRCVTGKDTIDAKYGLLSSTIDVKEIAALSNTEEQKKDYEPLFQALYSLHLPESVVKDILTVVFLARNKNFSWAVEWGDLRRRCKMLMSNASEKKRFVELNMDEANNRLKFLKIDYEKYKNRPQQDYGSIEQGYENLMNSGDMDDDSEESEEEDFEDDEDIYETQKGRGAKKQTEEVDDDNSQEEDPYLTGRRRTRARAAASMASLLFATDLTNRRTRRKKKDDDDEDYKGDDDKIIDLDEKSNDSKTEEVAAVSTPSALMDETNSETSDIPKKIIKDCLGERPLYENPTVGFQPLIDLWNIEKSDLNSIDDDYVSLLESSNVLQQFAKLKNINKEINPVGVDEEEQIDTDEMMIIHGDINKKYEKKNYVFSVRRYTNNDEVKVPEELVLSPDAQDTKQEKRQIKILDNNLIQKGADDAMDKNKPPSNIKVLEMEDSKDETSLKDGEKNTAKQDPCAAKIEESCFPNDDANANKRKRSNDVPADANTNNEYAIVVKEETSEVNASVEKEDSDVEKLKANETDASAENDIEMSDENERTEEIGAEKELNDVEMEQMEDVHMHKLNDKDVEKEKSDMKLSETTNKILTNEDIKNDDKQIDKKERNINISKVDRKQTERITPGESSQKHGLNDENEEIKNTKDNTEMSNSTKETEICFPKKDVEAAESNDLDKGNEKEEDNDKDKKVGPDTNNINISQATMEEKVEDKFTKIMEKSADNKNSVAGQFKSNEENEISEINDNQNDIGKSTNAHILNEKDEQFESKNNVNEKCKSDVKATSINKDDQSIEYVKSEKTQTIDAIKSTKFEKNKTNESRTNSDIVSETSKLNDIKDDKGNIDSFDVAEKQTDDGNLSAAAANEKENDGIESNKTETNKDETHITLKSDDMPLLDSEESDANIESTNAASNLKKISLTKSFKVLIRKLRPSDLVNLRQPKVRVKRIRDVESFIEKTHVKRQRLCKKAYIDVDDSSSNSLQSDYSSSEKYRPHKNKPRPLSRRRSVLQNPTSESESDSTKSCRLQARRVSTPNALPSQSKNTARCSTRQTAGDLIVTPRSASGLKLRISNVNQRSQTLRGKSKVSAVDEDIIQLSSSSSNDTNTMDSISEVIEIDDGVTISDPLFEEEMIL